VDATQATVVLSVLIDDMATVTTRLPEPSATRQVLLGGGHVSPGSSFLTNTPSQSRSYGKQCLLPSQDKTLGTCSAGGKTIAVIARFLLGKHDWHYSDVFLLAGSGGCTRQGR
jgi:hypothetical protein